MKTIKNLTKQQLLDALSNHELIEVYQPGPFPQTKDGVVTVNGKNWKLKVEIKDGFIKEITNDNHSINNTT